ncbi:MAG: mannose-1-phosphate guanylyltransferase/mannose-6-phosphate isomerase [Candidatus Pacebacteria bacterium]|nr:mannose-1-phosphate guanylyltransferase/mannose-6-phosphate isomerase [Candidatus Paceibacterota bacterium]
MIGIILCGGSGKRLWPLSRTNFPKQFLRLYSDRSLLQETFLRIQKVMSADHIYLVTNQANYYNVFNQIREVYPLIKKDQIIIEPISLNTAPAILLAVKYLSDRTKIDEKEPLIFLPADHYIGQSEKFAETVKLALENVGDNVGTLGIAPTGPETGFGYIEKGEPQGAYHLVKSFKEKPDRATAEKYLESGQYVWNGGIYFFSTETFLGEIKSHAPQLFEHFEKTYEEFLEGFGQLKEEPIDTALSEKSDKVIVFDGDFDWSDIGSFDALAEIAEKNNLLEPKHIFMDSNNVFAHSESDKTIATLGVDDVIIIESNDVVFVQKRGESEGVKKVVAYLKENKRKEAEHNVIVYRPWGKYEVLIDSDSHKVKKITVFPGASLSLQSHEHRSEHWVVVKGTATVVNGENLLTLRENESTYILAKSLHRLSNSEKENLEIIEVQTGDYLGEDDIVRYEDVYGRQDGV